MMQLVLDIGNTRTKIGLFEGRRLAEKTVWTDEPIEGLFEWTSRKKVRNAIYSSVVTDDGDLIKMLRKRFSAIELNSATPLPFHNAYRTPETLGKDRLAAAAGALALFPGRHCLVVDCGTCIKYELLTADGVYHGGNIAPGAAMRIQAMHYFTARLPEVPLEMPADAVGNSTTTALQNGALRGAALEIMGFARLFEQKANPLKIILTGGDAAFFKPHLDLPDLTLEPDLTLYGLNKILTFQHTP